MFYWIESFLCFEDFTITAVHDTDTVGNKTPLTIIRVGCRKHSVRERGSSQPVTISFSSVTSQTGLYWLFDWRVVSDLAYTSDGFCNPRATKFGTRKKVFEFIAFRLNEKWVVAKGFSISIRETAFLSYFRNHIIALCIAMISLVDTSMDMILILRYGFTAGVGNSDLQFTLG